MIHFFSAPTNLKNRTKLKKYILYLMKQEGRKVDTINIIFCTDKELLVINRNYLNHNFLTDIITFDLTQNKKLPACAELYISTERVKENAVIHKSTFKNELHRVIFHGLLHLCGYLDKTNQDIKVMRLKEDKYLNHYKP